MHPLLPTIACLATIAGASPINGPPVCSPRTELVGNGNPHQNYQYIQVSDNVQCGSQDSCSVSHLESQTIGYSASGGFSAWISGGFSVEKSYTTGNTYTCDGNAGQTVCVFDKVAFTAYTVETYGLGDECQSNSGPFVLTSPNTNNAGGEYECKYDGDCHQVTYSYWDRNGPATGPPS